MRDGDFIASKEVNENVSAIIIETCNFNLQTIIIIM